MIQADDAGFVGRVLALGKAAFELIHSLVVPLHIEAMVGVHPGGVLVGSDRVPCRYLLSVSLYLSHGSLRAVIVERPETIEVGVRCEGIRQTRKRRLVVFCHGEYLVVVELGGVAQVQAVG